MSQTFLYVVVGFLVLFVGLKFFGKKSQGEIQVIKEKIVAGAKVIDVRSPGEFSGGHYPNAVNIPVETIEGRLKEVGPKSQVIVVYCAAGGRSARAASILKNAGFSEVYNGGGLSDMPK